MQPIIKLKKQNAILGAAFLMATSAIGPGFLTQTTVFTQQLLASFGFVIGTPLANIFIKKEWTTRRGLSYIGLNVLAVGMVIRTGDFGD